jgi:antitoxin component of RelBE/YafQ-DinJ toxin-antitoxin module
MGMKPAQAFRLFIRHVESTRKLPFEIEHIPNKTTANALLMPDSEKGYMRFDSVEDLFAELNT